MANVSQVPCLSAKPLCDIQRLPILSVDVPCIANVPSYFSSSLELKWSSVLIVTFYAKFDIRSSKFHCNLERTKKAGLLQQNVYYIYSYKEYLHVILKKGTYKRAMQPIEQWITPEALSRAHLCFTGNWTILIKSQRWCSVNGGKSSFAVVSNVCTKISCESIWKCVTVKNHIEKISTLDMATSEKRAFGNWLAKLVLWQSHFAFFPSYLLESNLVHEVTGSVSVWTLKIVLRELACLPAFKQSTWNETTSH